MSALVVILVGIVCLLVGIGVGFWLPPHGRRPGKDRPKPVKRILLPFTGASISRRAFEAAVRVDEASPAGRDAMKRLRSE